MKSTKLHAVVFALLCVLMIGGWVAYPHEPLTHTIGITKPPTPTPTPYYHNVALLGYGGGSHEGGALTDSLIVARIDDRAQKITLVSVPRDLWVPLPLGKDGALVPQKINAAYAYGLDDTTYPNKKPEYQYKNGGGGALAKYALSQVIGEPIDHFAAVSFRSFTSLIDQLGGITIARDRAFLDEWYPIDGKENELCDHKEEEIKDLVATLSGRLLEQEFPCRYEKLDLTAGTHHLDGASALKYARSRKSETEGGDFYRSQHQKQVLEAIKTKALSINSFPALVRVATSISQYIDTDFALTDTPGLLKEYLRKKDYAIQSVALTLENVLDEGRGPHGQYILTPQYDETKWQIVHEYLQERYTGLSEASSTAKLRKKYAPTPTSTPKVGKDSANSKSKNQN